MLEKTNKHQIISILSPYLRNQAGNQAGLQASRLLNIQCHLQRSFGIVTAPKYCGVKVNDILLYACLTNIPTHS